MPPKKLTKAEKDRLKQEAERKAQEEEQQRLKEEEEQRLREEEARQQREEELKKLKAEENVRFDEERAQLYQIKDKIESSIEEWKKREKEDKEWKHYILCDKLPFVKDEKALNTYLSLYNEQTKPTSIDESLIRIQDLLKIFNDCEIVMQEEEAIEIATYLDRIQCLINQELNQATLLAMESYDQYIDSESFNLIVEREIPSLIYCLWGNIVKNPRLKDFSFKLRHFAMDIPKTLLLADVAIRVMYPAHDTLTPQCRTSDSTCSLDLAEKGKTPANEEVIEEREKEDNTNVDVVDGSKNASRTSSAKSLNESTVATNKKEEDETTITNNNDNITPNDSNIDNENKSEEKEEKQEKEEEIPQDEVDMRCYTVVGGPILLELLVLPSLPKSVNNWTIKQSTMTDIIHAPDPVDPSGVVPPIHITLGLPQDYLLHEEDSLQLAQWDEDKTAWRTKCVSDTKFDLINRSVSFAIRKFAPLAILIDTYINIPYESWELLPLGVNHTLYHITGGAVEVTIEIKGLECALIKPSEEPIVEKLLNIPMSAQNLMKALLNVGFNFFPPLDAHKVTTLTSKDVSLENSVYEYMSMACGGWGYQWSNWNNKSSENVIIRGSECTQEKWTQLKEDSDYMYQLDWNNYLASNESTYRLNISEGDDEFDATPADGYMTHPELYTTLLKASKPEVSELIAQTSPLHVDTVRKWLMITRPLSTTC